MTETHKCKTKGCNNPVEVSGMTCGMCLHKDYEAEQQRKQFEKSDRTTPVVEYVLIVLCAGFILACVLSVVKWLVGK